ncbi:hypothetical protein OAS95_03480 [Pelagibacteraceae bacterium]|nr:hypothetical protein [Pelagibacteraceae bacterium]
MNIDISNIEQPTTSVQFHKTSMYHTYNDTNSSSEESNSSGTEIKDIETPIMIRVNSDFPLQQTNIEEEGSIDTYTDNHFVTLSNRDLDNLHNTESLFIQNSEGNSPIMSDSNSNSNSNNNSNSNSNNNSDDEVVSNPRLMKNFKSNAIKNKYAKLNTTDIEKYVKKYYSNSPVDNYSSELDILTTFVRGQKNLYAQSRNITQQKLYLLMCPALIIAAAVTFISPFLECDTVNTNIVAGLNGVVTLFISMVGFFKLETLSEKYLILASLFDNSETELELASTKIMIMKKEKDISQLIISKFNETEDKITEYKLISQTLILPEIKLLFPIISHVNIFSFIKKIELLKRCTIEKLRNVKNEISYIQYRTDKKKQIQYIKTSTNSHLDNNNVEHEHQTKEDARLNKLFRFKSIITNELIELQNAYSIIDAIFYREISSAEKKQNRWWFCLLCFYWNKTDSSQDYIDDLLQQLSPTLREIILPIR